MARISRKKKADPAKQPVMPVEKTWQTAVYVRLSREDNLSGSDSIENQVALIDSYLADRPWLHRVGVFSDNGFTGTDFLRPGWQRLMKKVKDGEINCIVVKDLSRLGRNYIETGEFLEKICPFFGVRFIAINDGFDTETAHGDGHLSVSLSNIINDYYAKDISRKVSSSLRSKMENGDYIGNWEKYGYLKSPENKNQLIVNPETAPVVQMIYKWRGEGMSYMGINKKLNDMGIPSPGQYKADRGIQTNNNQKKRRILWNKHILTDILKDSTYLGHLAQQKNTQCLYAGIPATHQDEDDWIMVRNTHEAIIPEELFEKVQAVNRAAAAAQKARHGKYDYLPKAENIYGKRFTCADCGSVMKLVRSFSRNKDKVYFTYKCPVYAEHGARGCHKKRITKTELDRAVLEAIQSQMKLFIDIQDSLKQLTAAAKQKRKNPDYAGEIQSLKIKIEHRKSLFSGMYRDLKEGLLSQEDYAQTRGVLLEEIHQMEARLQEIQGMTQTDDTLYRTGGKWSELVEKYYGAAEISAGLADAFIASMKLHQDNSLEIMFNYMDEFTRIGDKIRALRKEVA